MYQLFYNYHVCYDTSKIDLDSIAYLEMKVNNEKYVVLFFVRRLVDTFVRSFFILKAIVMLIRKVEIRVIS